MPWSANRRTILRSTLAVAVAGSMPPNGEFQPGWRLSAQEAESPLSVAMLDEHVERMGDLTKTFSEQTGIELKIEPLSYADLYRELSLSLTQRSPAYDVVSLEDPWIPQFATFLTPLERTADAVNDTVEVAKALSRFPAEAAPVGRAWLGDCQFFVSRSAWLKRSALSAPESWEETVLAAEKISGELDPSSELSSFAISALSPHLLVDSFLPILRGCGRELLDPETSVPQLETPEALQAIGYFQSLASYSPAEAAATSSPSNADRFAEGQLAMMSNFWSSSLLLAAGDPDGNEAGPIEPGFQPAQGSFPRQSMTGAWLAAIPIGSLQPERSLDFVEWLISPAVQQSMLDRNLPPAARAPYADDASIDRQPHLQLMLELLEASKPRSRSPFYSQLEQLLAAQLAALLEGAQTGEEAMRRANFAMREFLVREGVLVS